MRYREISEATGPSVLYHVMTFEKAVSVADADHMDDRWVHKIGGREVSGNSFTRNNMFWFGGGHPVRLVVDDRALRQHNRVMPLDAEIVHRNTHRPDANVRPDRHDFRNPDLNFREEFVVGPIRNLHRIVLRVEIADTHVNGSIIHQLNGIIAWCNRYTLPFAIHPKTVARIRAIEAEWEEDESTFTPMAFPNATTEDPSLRPFRT